MFYIMYFCVCVLSHARLFVTPLTVAHQAPLSMGFFSQEYWSGLPFSTLGDRPKPRIEPVSLASPALQVDSLPLHHLGNYMRLLSQLKKKKKTMVYFSPHNIGPSVLTNNKKNHLTSENIEEFVECIVMPRYKLYCCVMTEKEMATHSSVLAWRIPGTGEPGGLPSMGLLRVRHD